MATKRMFSLQVTDTDHFLDMPVSAQALYFHLGMHGDDDGFVSSPRKVVRSVGCSNADMQILLDEGYLIQFESGVIVITDWNLNNTLKNDRYRTTIYVGEKSALQMDPSRRYFLSEPSRNQNGSTVEPQHNITRTEINKTEGEAAEPHTPAQFSPPSVSEVQKYCEENGLHHINAQKFVDHHTANGWIRGKAPIRDWKAVARIWDKEDSTVQSGSKVKSIPDIPGVETL